MCGAILLLAASGAQALDPHREVTQYQLDTWGVEDGLPGQAILELSQTPDSYLRLTTQHRSLRFDGVHFTNLVGVPSRRNPSRRNQAPSPTGSPNAPETPEIEGVEDAVTSLVDGNGNRWVATRTQGLLRINQSGRSALDSRSGLPDDHVTSLLEDREGNLWVGTADGSLSRLRNGKFILYSQREGLASGAVRTVFEDRRGSLWIGTDGGGLHRLENGRISRVGSPDSLPNNVILSLSQGRGGELWIGTAGGGLARLDAAYLEEASPEGPSSEEPSLERGDLTVLTTTEGLPSDIITAQIVDHDGDLWIGTLGGGVAHLRSGVVVEILAPPHHGIHNGIVRALLEDREGSLWVGTDDGLTRLQRVAGEYLPRTFSTADGLASNTVLSLLEDDEGQLWVGTDSGLSLLEGEVFRSVTSMENLFNDVLYQLLEDRQGNLWACSNRGVFSLRKSQVSQLLAGRVEELTPEPLAGSRAHECNGFSQPSGWRGDGGELWFSTIDGLLEVRPDSLVTNPLPAPVIIERVVVDFESIDPLTSPVLPPTTRSVEFRYTALSLVDARQVRFRHRLAPFEEEWSVPDSRRLIRYTNLPPGQYRLEITAANNDGLWNPRPAVFSFRIEPPFYRTVPFYGAVAMLVLGFGAGVYQLRFRRLQDRNRRLEEIISRRTAEVLERKEELGAANRQLA
ncbi:MAG: two-component regulator propeller domain-containing protein, partial [Acidobacteriota bacterium]|nr:two-component regulator propeller domain-containing protein [Acidobacteriota bacterium]